MEILTFKPSYTDNPKNQGNQNKQQRRDPEGIRIRIRHDIMDAAERQKPEGMTVKAYLNDKLSELLLADIRQ
jgi:hypothetical protein